MRLALCLVLFACSAALGFLFADRLTQRCRALRTVQGMLSALFMRLKYYQEPLYQAAAHTAPHLETEANDWLTALAHRLENGSSAGQALECILSQTKPPLALNQALGAEEKAALVELFERIGSHREDQEAAFALCAERLEQLLSAAEETRLRRGKLYRTVGVLGGAVWVILFL